jgi:putative NADPH-quinone reductase
MNILIINGHPYEDKLGYLLHRKYREGAEAAGHTVHEILLKDIHFSLNLEKGYKQLPEAELDIQKSQGEIARADHLVWIYPNWWGTYPALMKGFIDRIFLPGFAFRYESGKGRIPLLTNKSSRLIVSMDNPAWYYYLVLGAPGHKAMRRATLHFSGIRPVRALTLGRVRLASSDKIAKWEKLVWWMGYNGL